MNDIASRRSPVKEHMRFQRRTWAVERIGWGILLCISLLGLIGVFGGAGLSDSVKANDALSVHYDRFERRTRITEFRFQFAKAKGEQTFTLSKSFQDNFEISSIQPAPVRSEATAKGLSLTSSVDGDGMISLWAYPRAYGIKNLEASINDAAPLSFSVMIFP